jgi:2-oxo-4-hydroxy-4-carboxy-5-ureidoimidazoline decarboxylase
VGPIAQAGLAAFNAAPADEVDRALFACCASEQWARGVASGRPYPSAAALYQAADDALAELDDGAFDDALAGHPRIGDRSGSAASQREQAGVAGSPAETMDALAAGNREYEHRFGHVYLVCADGRGGDELLAILHARLHNDPATERANAREELRKINRIRLRRLIGESA